MQISVEVYFASQIPFLRIFHLYIYSAEAVRVYLQFQWEGVEKCKIEGIECSPVPTELEKFQSFSLNIGAIV